MPIFEHMEMLGKLGLILYAAFALAGVSLVAGLFVSLLIGPAHGFEAAIAVGVPGQARRPLGS